MSDSRLTNSVPELSAAGALRVVDAAITEAGRLGVGIVVSVVDRGGKQLAMSQMDGAPGCSIEVALKQAWTAASSGASTDALRDVFASDPTLVHGLAPKIEMALAVGGGTPIVVAGGLAGAVGVSGATEGQDQAIADHAAAAIIEAG